MLMYVSEVLSFILSHPEMDKVAVVRQVHLRCEVLVSTIIQSSGERRKMMHCIYSESLSRHKIYWFKTNDLL